MVESGSRALRRCCIARRRRAPDAVGRIDLRHHLAVSGHVHGDGAMLARIVMIEIVTPPDHAIAFDRAGRRRRDVHMLEDVEQAARGHVGLDVVAVVFDGRVDRDAAERDNGERRALIFERKGVSRRRRRDEGGEEGDEAEAHYARA